MEKQVRVCVACWVDTLQGESVERREGRRRLGQAPGNLLRGLQRSLRGPAEEAGRGKVGACCVRPASLVTVKVMVEGKISYRTFSFFISFFFFFCILLLQYSIKTNGPFVFPQGGRLNERH